MLKEELIAKLEREEVCKPIVLEAMAKIPREEFIDSQYRHYAYEDMPLPIACKQTISQPFIVAYMTSLLLRDKNSLGRVLEIGTGSGYQAAVLSQLAHEVFTIERIQSLFESAKNHLADYDNVQVFWADGCKGLKEHAPYDGIIVTAFCPEILSSWLSQLADGGCLVLPLEIKYIQYLVRVTRRGQHFEQEQFSAVQFVPLLGGRT